MYTAKEAYREAWGKAYEKDPPVPLNLDLELASACNAKCTFCLYGDRDWDQSMKEPDWDGKPKKRLMPTAMALRLIAEAATLGIPAIKFNFRGESLLHPEYGVIVDHARSISRAGAPAFLDLLANTNGNIPDKNWEGGIAGLMACTKVMVSLDSLDPAIYPKVRVGLSLESAIKTIDELVRRWHPDLWVRRVVCKDNKDEPFVKSAYARWPKGVKVSEHHAFERNHYANEALYEDDSSKWPRKFCGYPAQRIVVEASGRYVPCCIAWGGEFDAGKWPELSLKDYWTGEWRRNLAEELRRGEFKNAKCKACTSFMSFDRKEREFVQDVESSREAVSTP